MNSLTHLILARLPFVLSPYLGRQRYHMVHVCILNNGGPLDQLVEQWISNGHSYQMNTENTGYPALDLTWMAS